MITFWHVLRTFYMSVWNGHHAVVILQSKIRLVLPINWYVFRRFHHFKVATCFKAICGVFCDSICFAIIFLAHWRHIFGTRDCYGFGVIRGMACWNPILVFGTHFLNLSIILNSVRLYLWIPSLSGLWLSLWMRFLTKHQSFWAIHAKYRVLKVVIFLISELDDMLSCSILPINRSEHARLNWFGYWWLSQDIVSNFWRMFPWKAFGMLWLWGIIRLVLRRWTANISYSIFSGSFFHRCKFGVWPIIYQKRAICMY